MFAQYYKRGLPEECQRKAPRSEIDFWFLLAYFYCHVVYYTGCYAAFVDVAACAVAVTAKSWPIICFPEQNVCV